MWQRMRLWYWTRLWGLSREAALDLMDGIDDGDRAIVSIGFRLDLERRKGLTADDLDRLDADFTAGGPMQDEVLQRAKTDLNKRDSKIIIERYLARRN